MTAGGSAALLLTCALPGHGDDEILLTDPSYLQPPWVVRVALARTLPVGTGHRLHQFTAAVIDQAWQTAEPKRRATVAARQTRTGIQPAGR